MGKKWVFQKQKKSLGCDTIPWKIELSEEAFRDLSNLQQRDIKRIINKLKNSPKEPKHFFKRLKGYDEYKLKVGDYRVIALLIHERKVIFVEKIGHRRKIYKEKHI